VNIGATEPWIEIDTEKGDNPTSYFLYGAIFSMADPCSSRLAAAAFRPRETRFLRSFTVISMEQAGCRPPHEICGDAVGKALRRGILFLTRKAEPHLVMTSAQHACAPYA